MEYLAEYGLFLAKIITLVVAVVMTVGGIVSMIFKHKKPVKPTLVVEHLNKRYEDMAKGLSSVLRSDLELQIEEKQEHKAAKKQAKKDKKAAKGGNTSDSRRKIYVLDFNGDVQASAVKAMREEISTVLSVASPSDEVVVRLESGGGLVHSYGLAASQLTRIRAAHIPLTITVDKVAASGGYMMACVANKIIAAPFALVGSIGVIAQIPNVHRLLKKHDVDFEQICAGEYKRTLTMFGENTDKGREKMRDDLEETHRSFKDFIEAQRPALDIAAVATGEVWLGTKALALGLIDELGTSDDYLMAASKDADLIQLSLKEKKSKLGEIGGLLRLRSPLSSFFDSEKLLGPEQIQEQRIQHKAQSQYFL